MGESTFQRKLLDRIEELFPGCIILKNDPNYLLDFPDWLILYGPRWAALEAKTSEDSHRQPNQEYWVEYCNEISYGSFVFPENEEEVLNAIQQALRPW